MSEDENNRVIYSRDVLCTQSHVTYAYIMRMYGRYTHNTMAIVSALLLIRNSLRAYKTIRDDSHSPWHVWPLTHIRMDCHPLVSVSKFINYVIITGTVIGTKWHWCKTSARALKTDKLNGISVIYISWLMMIAKWISIEPNLILDLKQMLQWFAWYRCTPNGSIFFHPENGLLLWSSRKVENLIIPYRKQLHTWHLYFYRTYQFNLLNEFVCLSFISGAMQCYSTYRIYRSLSISIIPLK